MPVTAKFSEKFYARLGHDVAEELVDWFNKVDTTYHTDLVRLNELNFARFEAKLDQRVAELRTEFHREFSRLETKLDQRFAETKADVARLEERMNQRFETILQQQRTAIADLRAELIKWMFLFWVGTLGTLIALLKLWG